MIFSSSEKILTLLIRSSWKYFPLEKPIAEIYAQIWAVMNISDKHMQFLDAEHRMLARLCAVAVVVVDFG